MYDERQPDEPALPAELAALEKKLADFAPAAPRLDRDRLMFAAGRASWEGAGSPDSESRISHVVPLKWFWPTATMSMTAATLFLAAMLVWQRRDGKLAGTPLAVDAVVADEIEPFDARRDAWRRPDRMPRGYLGLRYVALTQGVGAIGSELPAVNGEAGEPSPPATSRQLLEEFLPAAKHPSS